jgi:hypothetical protein
VEALAQRASITGGGALTIGWRTALGLGIVCNALAGVCGAGVTLATVGGARTGINVASGRMICGTVISRCSAGSGLAAGRATVNGGSSGIRMLGSRSGSLRSGFSTRSDGIGFLPLLSFQRQTLGECEVRLR